MDHKEDHYSLEDKRPALHEHASPFVDERRSSRHEFSKDESIIARFGKRQQLRVSIPAILRKEPTDGMLQRGFGPVSAIALTMTLMITWEAILASVDLSGYSCF